MEQFQACLLQGEGAHGVPLQQRQFTPPVVHPGTAALIPEGLIELQALLVQPARGLVRALVAVRVAEVPECLGPARLIACCRAEGEPLF